MAHACFMMDSGRQTDNLSWQINKYLGSTENFPTRLDLTTQKHIQLQIDVVKPALDKNISYCKNNYSLDENTFYYTNDYFLEVSLLDNYVDQQEYFRVAPHSKFILTRENGPLVNVDIDERAPAATSGHFLTVNARGHDPSVSPRSQSKMVFTQPLPKEKWINNRPSLQYFSLIGATHIYTYVDEIIRYRARIESGGKAIIYNPDTLHPVPVMSSARPFTYNSTHNSYEWFTTDWDDKPWTAGAGFEFSRMQLKDYELFSRFLYTDDWQTSATNGTMH